MKPSTPSVFERLVPQHVLDMIEGVRRHRFRHKDKSWREGYRYACLSMETTIKDIERISQWQKPLTKKDMQTHIVSAKTTAKDHT